MNKLVLEIGFGELLIAILSSALVGVLLMLLYHRLAMRRERELTRSRNDGIAVTHRPPESAAPAPGATPTPPNAPSSANAEPLAESSGPALIIPDGNDSLDFHNPGERT